MNSSRLNNKLVFCSEDVWKKVFLIKKNILFKNQEKIIYHRSSVIPKLFLNDEVSIYTGKRWVKKYINRWMVGFKFGEFTWNKKAARYKAKQTKKKKIKLFEIWTITTSLLIKRFLFCWSNENF